MTNFDAKTYLHYLYQEAYKDLASAFRIDLLSSRPLYYQGKRVRRPSTVAEMDEVAELARAQLQETLTDGSGCLDFDPPTVNELEAQDDVPNSSETIGFGYDIAIDAKVWEAAAEAALTFRRAAEQKKQRTIANAFNKAKSKKAA